MSVKPKILIVEDNAVNAKLLTVYLETSDFEVIHAEDGHSGLEKVAANPDINAILLDRIMPDMDGLEMLKSLKKNDATWKIPVIMLTAAMSPKQIEEATLYGAFTCLPKPYDKDKIISTLNEAIRGGRRR
jgi:CheY-like chemotaxis protein